MGSSPHAHLHGRGQAPETVIDASAHRSPAALVARPPSGSLGAARAVDNAVEAATANSIVRAIKQRVTTFDGM